MSGYTLIVKIKEEDLTDAEFEAFADTRRLTLFRKGRTIEELRDALDFWTCRGFSAWIYQSLDVEASE